jgi:hypothetical protein
MKNLTKLVGIAALFAVIMFSFAACVGTPPPATPAPQPEPVAQPAPQPDSPPPPPPPPPPAAARTTLILDGARNYTVKSGDTLVDIAKQFYNNGYYYPVIFVANVPKIQDADVIEPGTQLIIPDLQRNLNDSGAREVIRLLLIGTIPFENSRNRSDTANGLRELSNSL